MAMDLSRFLSELRRRKVTRVAVAYVVGGLAAVEGAQILGEPLGLPPVLIQAAAFLVVIGFPIALVLAWAFFNDTATTEIYTLSLHDALPIYHRARPDHRPSHRQGCQGCRRCAHRHR